MATRRELLHDGMLRDANLRKADLQRADLSQSDLRGASFLEANLMRVDFTTQSEMSVLRGIARFSITMK